MFLFALHPVEFSCGALFRWNQCLGWVFSKTLLSSFLTSFSTFTEISWLREENIDQREKRRNHWSVYIDKSFGLLYALIVIAMRAHLKYIKRWTLQRFFVDRKYGLFTWMCVHRKERGAFNSTACAMRIAHMVKYTLFTSHDERALSRKDGNSKPKNQFKFCNQ